MSSRERVLACCRAMEQMGGPLPLGRLGQFAGCSARQVQRDFSAIGITAPAYGRAVRTEAARLALRRTGSILEAVDDSGYGSVRAFYEEAGQRLGMTPSSYAAGGAGTRLIWATTPTALGLVIAVGSPVGLCTVRIGARRADLVSEIEAEFASAELSEEPAVMGDVLRALRALALGQQAAALPIDVQGTAFQARVWAALRQIPPGQTRTYTQVAEAIDAPASVRAVAAACAGNRVALVVPCHRVIRVDGDLAGYRWGLEVKEQLLAAELAAAGSGEA